MNVYLLTSKVYYTDGEGFVVGIFSTKKLALKHLRQNKNIRHNKGNNWYEDDTSQLLFKIRKYRLNEVDN